MSDAKHTPGPWSVGEHDTNGQRIVRGEYIEIATCWHHSVGSIEAEMECNARLIAAAPDLLEALMGLVDLCNHGSSPRAFHNGVEHNGMDEGDLRAGEYVRIAMAAIAKATGAA